MEDVIRLYPGPTTEKPLQGLYLEHDLRSSGLPGRPFVYTNFIASLDGRISQPDPDTGLRRVPPALANPRDWRLYMELAAQADALLTTGRHLRAVAAGRHSELLGIPPKKYPDLVAWRRERGLPEQPVCVAASRNLKLPVAALRQPHLGRIIVATSAMADDNARQALEQEGIEVIYAGGGPQFSAEALVNELGKRGILTVYSIAGPAIHHSLLEANRLDRLFVTTAHMILGGEEMDTLTRGRFLEPARAFRLHELYYDQYAPPNAGQLLACYMAAD